LRFAGATQASPFQGSYNVWRNYLASALGSLSRNRFYAVINISGLALGISAALLIALFVRDEYTYDQFFPGYRDVYLLTQTEEMIDHRLPNERIDSSLPNLAAKLAAQFPQIAAVARIMPADNPPHIRHDQVEADETGFLWVDPSFFRIIPLKSLAGDLQTALATPDSVVLTRSAARKYFGRDNPVGELLEVNPAMGSDATAVSAAFDKPHPMRVTAIIEELPSNSYIKGEMFGSGLASYSTFSLYDLTPDRGPFRGNSNYTFIRLKPGASVQQLRQQVSAFATHNSDTSTVYPPGFTLALHLTPIGDLHLSAPSSLSMSPRGDRTLLAALIAIAVLIVSSASFNFVALMTARAAQRATETGVRKAAGALRGQLIIQFLGEALIYVTLAMTLAVAITEVSLPHLNAVLKQSIAFNYFDDPALLGALLVATVGLSVLAGAYPALVLSAFRPATVLKGTLVQGATGGFVRRGLVALQFAIMIGLGITALTIWRQTLFSLNNQLRVDGSRILLIDDGCTPSARAFRDRLTTVPGVARFACANEAALFNGGMIVSAQVQGGAEAKMVSGTFDYGALDFYGLRPLAGRFFDRSHGADGRLVEGDTAGNPSVVVNGTAMRKLGFSSPSQAIGKTVIWNRRRWSPKPMPGTVGPSEIIGVSPDFALDTHRPVLPQILYVDPGSFSVLSVRLIGSQIPETLTAIDADWSELTHTSMHRHFLSQTLQTMYADVILQGTAITMGAGLAGLIAALGLFGLSAHSAERRTKEIGVRKAMGAGSRDIVRLLLGEFSRPVVWANLIAWPIAWWAMSRWLSGFPRHVDLPFWLFLMAGGGALLVAYATALHHALAAARRSPATALHYE
jgi:putative ABC transport system permease protein